jgi:hypothetical protein
VRRSDLATLHVPTVQKFWKLQPAGAQESVQACVGLALPFICTYIPAYLKNVAGIDRGPFCCSVPTHVEALGTSRRFPLSPGGVWIRFEPDSS